MANLSMKFFGIRTTRAELARITRSADRATMWTVRQVGRKAKQYAKSGAPVYRGKARDRYFRGANIGPMGKGDLKKSIHSAKRLKHPGPGTWVNTVAPRGVANIYAARQEARAPFMAPARSRASAVARGIAAGAYMRATRKR